MPIFTSHPVLPCPVMLFSSDFSDCQLPILTCLHGIECPLLTVNVIGGPIECLEDLTVQAPVNSCDPDEIQDLICCAQHVEDCLSDLGMVTGAKIYPTCTAYCGPVCANFNVNLRNCTAWLTNIVPPFSDCAV